MCRHIVLTRRFARCWCYVLQHLVLLICERTKIIVKGFLVLLICERTKIIVKDFLVWPLGADYSVILCRPVLVFDPVWNIRIKESTSVQNICKIQANNFCPTPEIKLMQGEILLPCSVTIEWRLDADYNVILTSPRFRLDPVWNIKMKEGLDVQSTCKDPGQQCLPNARNQLFKVKVYCLLWLLGVDRAHITM